MGIIRFKKIILTFKNTEVIVKKHLREFRRYSLESCENFQKF